MVKVRISQIPEESGKPQRFKTKGGKKIPVSDDTFLDEEEEDSYNTSEEDSDNEVRYFKTMINIPEVGSISLSGIETIEKDFRVIESNYGTNEVKLQYGIIINRGMEPSMRYPRVDIDIWFNTEEVRDQRYNRIVSILENSGVKFINV